MQQRRFTAPFQIVSGGTRITLVAHGEAPREPGGAVAGGPERRLHDAGAGGAGEDALLLNRIVLRGSLIRPSAGWTSRATSTARISASPAPAASISPPRDPRIVAGLAGRNFNAGTFKQMWPVFMNTPVRDWVVEHLLGGTMERVEIAVNAPLSTLRNGGPPVPDDGLSIRVDTKNALHPAARRPAGRSATPT